MNTTLLWFLKWLPTSTSWWKSGCQRIWAGRVSYLRIQLFWMVGCLLSGKSSFKHSWGVGLLFPESTWRKSLESARVPLTAMVWPSFLSFSNCKRAFLVSTSPMTEHSWLSRTCLARLSTMLISCTAWASCALGLYSTFCPLCSFWMRYIRTRSTWHLNNGSYLKFKSYGTLKYEDFSIALFIGLNIS